MSKDTKLEITAGGKTVKTTVGGLESMNRAVKKARLAGEKNGLAYRRCQKCGDRYLAGLWLGGKCPGCGK
jgi:hypothetical protein